jgi:hypothetical protein
MKVPRNNRNHKTQNITWNIISVLPPFPETLLVSPLCVAFLATGVSLSVIYFHQFSEQQNLFFPTVLLKSIFRIPLYEMQPISDSYSQGINRIDTFKIQFSMTILLPLTTKRTVFNCKIPLYGLHSRIQPILNRNKATSHTF